MLSILRFRSGFTPPPIKAQQFCSKAYVSGVLQGLFAAPVTLIVVLRVAKEVEAPAKRSCVITKWLLVSTNDSSYSEGLADTEGL